MRWAGRAGATGLAPAALMLAALTVTALAGCATRPRPIVSDNRYAPLSEGPTARAVRGEVVDEAALVPEPGDIWADIVPGRRLAGPIAAPPDTARSVAAEPMPKDRRSAAAPSAGASRGQTTATMVAPPQTGADTVEWLAIAPSPPSRSGAAPGSKGAPASTTGNTVPATTTGTASATTTGITASATTTGNTASATDAAAPSGRPVASATASPAPPGPGDQAPLAAQVPAPNEGATTEGVRVQLMAAGSEAEARAAWAHLDKHAPDLLRGRSPQLVLAEANGRTVWRLRTGGFASRTEAAGFCARARDAGAQCWVVGSGA